MKEGSLADDSDASLEHDRRLAGRLDYAERDGPEFSSGPFPAAYAIFYSVVIGAVLIALICAAVW